MPLTDFLVPSDCGACGHYRILRPGKVQADLTHRETRQWMVRPSFKDWARYDIGKVLFNRAMGDADVRYWAQFRKQFPNVPLILDFDDALWSTHPRSSYAPTRPMLKNMDTISGMADVIIASTPYLQDKLEQRYRRDIRLMPNLLFDREFAPSLVVRSPEEKLRVLWSGSDTHAPDLDQIIPVVQATHDRYHWIFKGYVPPVLKGLVEYQPITPTLTYLDELRRLNAHVGIAPLIDNRFNRCKSNLKILEYSALGMAVLASNVEPYEQSSITTVQGTRSRHWLSALRRFEDEEERQYSAKIGRAWARLFAFENPLRLSTILGAYAC